MNYILFSSLLIILLIKVYISKDWLRPSTLYTLGFTYAAFILSVDTVKWGYILSTKTVILIIISQFMIWIGDAIGSRLGIADFRIGHNQLTQRPYNARKEQIVYTISIVCILVLVAIRIQNIRNSNFLYGTGQYYLSNYRRYGIEDTSGDFVMKLFEILSSMFCYYFFCDICLSGIKKKRKNIIPIGLYIISCVLSSARSSILHFIFACTLIWILSNRYKNSVIKISSKMKRRIIIILVLGLLSFGILGYLTGKTQTEGFFDSIEVYSAGSLPALDSFVKEFDGHVSFGYYTLQGIRRILELLGVNVTYNVSYFSHGEFIKFGNGYVTNIYTCFRNYLTDYGFIGSQILIFLIGLVFGKFYRRMISKERLTPYRYTLYSVLIFYVFFSFITERVFSQILTATTIIGILFISWLFKSLPMQGDKL